MFNGKRATRALPKTATQRVVKQIGENLRLGTTRVCLAGWPYAAGWLANFSLASGVTGVKRFTKLPSGSRKSSERLPHGMVVGACTSALLSMSAKRW
jgi:hypothetical protein